jgi:Ca2+/Na+ antiporter
MRQSTDQTNNLIYTESISSNKTEALFLVLMMLSLLLLIWRVTSDGLDILAVAFICLFILFLFYSLNYRNLLIHLTTDSLKLTFGIFTWTIPVDNIQEYCLDELPIIMKYGGAGIHFMFVRKRYRASFNFLEYPRIVIAFKRKVGLVRDISFSTRQPGDIIHLIQEIISANQAA